MEATVILKRYWPILLADGDLKETLKEYPYITCRRGQNLRDQLAHSTYQEKQGETYVKGSYPCGSCTFCKFLPKIKEFTIPSYGRKIELCQFINCRSMGIVYVATCTCPKLYVGKTIQEFRQRISKYISSIQRGEETPIARHIRDYHQANVIVLKFWGVSQIKLGRRKGNLDKLLLREEAR